jgi:hypothetical protein
MVLMSNDYCCIVLWCHRVTVLVLLSNGHCVQNNGYCVTVNVGLPTTQFWCVAEVLQGCAEVLLWCHKSVRCGSTVVAWSIGVTVVLQECWMEMRNTECVSEATE